jgi:conjugal transfer pilus assembly protein TraB
MGNNMRPLFIKKSQQRTASIVLVIFAVCGLGLYEFLEGGSTAAQTKDQTETVTLATPLSHVDEQALWVERAQQQLSQEDKTTTAVKEQLQLLSQAKEAQDKKAQGQAQSVADLQKQVTQLQAQLTDKSNHQPVQMSDANSTQTFSLQKNDHFLNDVKLTLKPLVSIHHAPTKNPNNYVPAGSFVEAIVIGGADASAGVTSQGNPSPMLLRMIAPGTLPNHQHSHLQDCFATAAVVGDISSERGEIRLERFSCVLPHGKTIDVPVEATVFGPDGKNAVRGTPLWREGKLLQRAFVAGTLSGISSGIGQTYTSNAISPIGSVQTVKNGKILQYGVANGIGNAADKLADYNISRAEQYHPVIQLSAGTVVDVVFLKGFYIDGKRHGNDDDDLLATPPASPTAASDLSSPSEQSDPSASLPLTEEQIQALQQKNAQQGNSL